MHVIIGVGPTSWLQLIAAILHSPLRPTQLVAQRDCTEWKRKLRRDFTSCRSFTCDIPLTLKTLFPREWHGLVFILTYQKTRQKQAEQSRQQDIVCLVKCSIQTLKVATVLQWFKPAHGVVDMGFRSLMFFFLVSPFSRRWTARIHLRLIELFPMSCKLVLLK